MLRTVKARTAALWVLTGAVLSLGGCATAFTLGEDDYKSKVYSGTRAHIEGQCAHGSRVDMPFSIIADTVLLPITVPWTIAKFVLPAQQDPERFAGVTYETVSRGELLKRVQERTVEQGSDVSILWYSGTKGDHHYLAHVYRVFGASDYYRIPASDLSIPQAEILPLVRGQQSKRIARIGETWQAARKREGSWMPERQGFALD